MLIKCNECDKEISDQAKACPGCGAPVKQAAQPNEVQTIEQTGKKWKSTQLSGGVLVGLGIFLMFQGGGDDGGLYAVLGMLTGILGAALYVYGRVSAWWHHG